MEGKAALSTSSLLQIAEHHEKYHNMNYTYMPTYVEFVTIVYKNMHKHFVNMANYSFPKHFLEDLSDYGRFGADDFWTITGLAVAFTVIRYLTALLIFRHVPIMAYLNFVTEKYPDTVYPERLSLHKVSQLNRANSALLEVPNPDQSSRFNTRVPKKARQSNYNRFKTQPVTFDEIKEVDEETFAEEDDGNATAERMKTKSDDLRNRFAEFSKTMEALVNLKFDDATAESQERLFSTKRAQRHRGANKKKNLPKLSENTEEQENLADNASLAHQQANIANLAGNASLAHQQANITNNNCTSSTGVLDNEKT